jgi:adenylosuccinate synthase
VKGHEFGATTGRKRRCGWLDMVALNRSFRLNSVSGICITKLDVLDGLETIRICTAYELDGERIEVPPAGADALARCSPVFVEMPGWAESSMGATSLAALPDNARAYLARIEELSGLPIDIISTGPDRSQTIVGRHPFDA